MPAGLVHDASTFVALGRTYRGVHKWKDAPARQTPGLAHRGVRHGWYQACGKLWDLDNPVPDVLRKRIQRVRDVLGSTEAEEYMASVGHDHLDRVWDYRGLPRSDRRVTRKYWEAFFVWLILNPILLKTWGGVDVFTGRVQRLIDGLEIWEEDPGVKQDYDALLRRARLLVRWDKGVARMLQQYSGPAL